MNFLDIRTVMVSQLVTDAACVAVLVSLWLQNRRHFAGTFLWAADFIFQTLGVLLISLRGAIPDGMSMGVSNTLVIAGALLGFWGLERFLGRKSPQLHNYFLLAVFVGLQFYFIYGKNNLDVRTLNISAALFLVCIQCAWLMLRRAGRAQIRNTQAVGWVFVFFCLVSIVRIIILLVHPPASNDFFQSGLYDALTLIAYQILLILLAFSLALMINQRLLADVKIQEEKLAKAFHSSPYAILITRFSDGLILDVNRGFEELTGYPPSEVIGKTTLNLGLWANPADRRVAAAELTAKGEVHGMEFSFRSKSGREWIGMYYGEILVVNDERLILSSISDVTERKRAEEKLRYQASLLENVNDAIVASDAEFRLTAWNAAAEKLYGWTAGEVLGKTGLEITRTEWPAADAEEMRRKIAQEGHWRGEATQLRKDGSRIPVEVSSLVLRDSHKQITDYISINHDITERKQAEETLKKTLADLERSNADLEQFAYIVSHDLQEPLRMVSSFTQLLADRHQGRLDKDADEFIAYAVDGANHMHRLINDLLAYSRVGTRGKPPAPVPADAALDQALENLTLTLEESRAEVKREPLPTVMVDDVQLVQVFQNLIANALKYRGEAPPRIVIACRAQGAEWVFSVRDNGIGIEPQYLERIFVIFQRLPKREEYPGSGIGLAICKKIIQRHGGRMWAESKPGEGSTFFFTLPKPERK
jgi:PAS domain S-box-containing protein